VYRGAREKEPIATEKPIAATAWQTGDITRRKSDFSEGKWKIEATVTRVRGIGFPL